MADQYPPGTTPARLDLSAQMMHDTPLDHGAVCFMLPSYARIMAMTRVRDRVVIVTEDGVYITRLAHPGFYVEKVAYL